MQADAELLKKEARTEIKRALHRHDDPEEVLLYAASQLHVWQELLSLAQMAPQKLAEKLEQVDDHLTAHMTDYLNEDSQ